MRLTGYFSVEDAGLEINPLVVDGQRHGAAAQGIGQALLEDVRYDPESGQLLTGSFMDYAMPRADDLPAITLASHVTLTETNPLGVKGVGELGHRRPAAGDRQCDPRCPLAPRRPPCGDAVHGRAGLARDPGRVEIAAAGLLFAAQTAAQ